MCLANPSGDTERIGDRRTATAYLNQVVVKKLFRERDSCSM